MKVKIKRLEKRVYPLLCCPYCKSKLERNKDFFCCLLCTRVYPIIDDIPYLLPDAIKHQLPKVKFFFRKHKIKEKITLPKGAWQWKEEKVASEWDLLSRFLKKASSSSKRDDLVKKDGFTLDIGCGNKPRGDVNIDVFLPDPRPKNFIMASAELLPFKPKSFDLVLSTHVIEHLINPASFIEEQVKIARKKVILIADNSEWLGTIWMRFVGKGYLFCSQHYYQWTKEYLANLIKRLGMSGTVKLVNLNPSFLVKVVTFPGKLGILPNLFYIDLKLEILTGKKQ